MQGESEPLDPVLEFLDQFEWATASTRLGNFCHSQVDIQDSLLSPCAAVSLPPDDALFQLTGDIFRDESPSDKAGRASDPKSPSADDEADQATTKKPKRVRTSRKQQIATLRATMTDLTAELESLAPRSEGKGSMWRPIAARQLERRQQSEAENAKLRTMLGIQLQEARNLKRVLKRRSKIELLEEMLGAKRLKAMDPVPSDNPQVFESMLHDADELYVGVEALFNEKRIKDLACPGRARDAKHNVTNGLFLELSQKHITPFSFQQTAKAMWTALCQVGFQNLQSVGDLSKHANFRVLQVEEANNTLMMSYVAEITGMPHLGNVEGAHFRRAVRKYVESDRAVFICKDLMEPIIRGQKKKTGFHTRTTLQITVRSGDAGTSVITSHFTGTRHDQGSPVAQGMRTTSNLDLGIAAWDEAVSRIAHQVESLAIDASCGKVVRSQ